MDLENPNIKEINISDPEFQPFFPKKIEVKNDENENNFGKIGKFFKYFYKKIK